MSHQKKKWTGRAPDATADELFERALLGDEPSGRKSFDPREDRKTRQLCQQVKRALMLAMAGECDDDILRELYVDAVEPMGGSAQLLVRVIVPATVESPIWEVLGRLNDRSARLRACVAQSICRKKVPGLSFVAVPQTGTSFEGGTP